MDLDNEFFHILKAYKMNICKLKGYGKRGPDASTLTLKLIRSFMMNEKSKNQVNNIRDYKELFI